MQVVCEVKSIGGRLRAVDGDGRAFDVAGLPDEGAWIELRGDGGYRLLAGAGSRLADLIGLVVGHGVSPIQDDVVDEEANRVAGDLALDELPDFRHLPLVPIDETTSRDLDQAVAIEPRGDGWVVWYALADAAWFVRPGSALYAASLERGATTYLPGLVVPMLPRILSEDRISLNAGVDRRAMLFELTLDADGRCIERAIHRARIHCRHKLDFGSVQRFLDGEMVNWYADVQASLRRLAEVGRARMKLAEDRGVVQYRRTEVDVHLHGLVFVALEGPRNDVERYNEQISLLTNVQGALFLLERETDPRVQPIYRVHEAPSETRYQELHALTVALARVHDLPDDWIWNEEEPLAEYLARLPRNPIGRAVHRQAMIVNRPSHFASTPGAHFGIGADVYGRFTAPMREVVGVYLHHEVWAALALTDSGQDGDLRKRVVDVSNAARERQRRLNREVNRMVLDDLFSTDPSATFDGVVLGMTPSRVHVQLDEPRVDVKVYVTHLEGAWRADLQVVDGVALVDGSGGMWVRLGEPVQVEVLGRDARSDRWELGIRPVKP